MNEALFNWILSIGKIVAFAAASWFVWTLRNAFIAGWNIQKFVGRFDKFETDTNRSFEDLSKETTRSVVEAKKEADREIVELKRRLDRAGELMSDLATDIQTMPERIRAECITRREIDLLNSESKVDRERLWQETRDLWKVVNRREEEKRRR